MKRFGSIDIFTLIKETTCLITQFPNKIYHGLQFLKFRRFFRIFEYSDYTQRIKVNSKLNRKTQNKRKKSVFAYSLCIVITDCCKSFYNFKRKPNFKYFSIVSLPISYSTKRAIKYKVAME